MRLDIDLDSSLLGHRLIAGLQVLSKYKPDAYFFPYSGVTFVIQVQELEFIDVSDSDRALLNSFGWRNPSVCLWLCLSDHGLSKE